MDSWSPRGVLVDSWTPRGRALELGSIHFFVIDSRSTRRRRVDYQSTSCVYSALQAGRVGYK